MSNVLNNTIVQVFLKYMLNFENTKRTNVVINPKLSVDEQIWYLGFYFVLAFGVAFSLPYHNFWYDNLHTKMI